MPVRKNDARKFFSRTPAYVVMHGAFARNRGRKASATLEGEQNPRKALELAHNIVSLTARIMPHVKKGRLTFRELDETPQEKLSADMVTACMIEYAEKSRAAISDRVVIDLIDRLGNALTPAHKYLIRQAARSGEDFKAANSDPKSAGEYRRVREYLSN